MYALIPTHRQLLLRSPMADRWSERIDLVFKGVSSININASVSNLAIHMADRSKAESIAAGAGLSPELGNDENVYLMTGEKSSGYVIAASLWMATDQQHATNPSPLFFDVEGTAAPKKIF